MKKRFLSCAIALLLVIACISGLSARAYAAENGPKITLNYSTKDVDVNHGFTLVATVQAQGSGTITWSSSDTYVASVSASGYVSGKNAGKATITATYRGSDGSTTSKSCNVHVTVEDGLYYIKNAYSDLCMNTNGSAISLQAQDPNENSRLDQLWYISYVAGYDRYSIRPISDFSLSMDVDVGNYVTVDQNEVGAYWDIVAYSFGFTIRYYGNSNENAKPVVADMPGSQIYLGSWETNLKCHWELEKAYGVFLRDTDTKKLITNTDRIPLSYGMEHSLSDLGVEMETYGSMTGGMTWSTSASSVATVNASYKVVSQNAAIASTANITVRTYLNGKQYSASMTVITVYPLSGYELDYEPERWNGVQTEYGYYICQYTNCYAYALNVQTYPGTNSLWYMQPGQAAGIPLFSNIASITYDVVNYYVSLDADALDFVFRPISKTDICSEGCYKVALVMDTGYDYHWYRQNADGTWSHKLATNDVTNLDASGNIIYDPELADRDYSDNGGYVYTDYICFFEVSPLNFWYVRDMGEIMSQSVFDGC